MRILLIVTRSDLGGAQTVVVNIANYLAKVHDVVVAAGSGDGKMWEMLDATVRQEFVPSLKRELSPIDELKTLRIFRRLYRKHRPDVIHLHSSKVGILGRLAFPKDKVVYTVHGFDSIRIAYRKFLPLERFLQKYCAAIVGVSNYDKNNLLAERIHNNVGVVYNGIEKPSSLPENPLKRLDEYRAKVLCIARLSPPKNIDLFLEVARKLPQYAFVWVGNQHEVDFDYPHNVFFLGSIPNAGAYNEFADLFMLPSNYEGLPMTIIEAMSFGKPVVASDVGGISEIVVNGENGFVVENTIEAFVEKVQYVLENKKVYDCFSSNSMERFAKELTVNEMVSGYMKIYQAIVKGDVK